MFPPSSISQISVNGRVFYVKRDDLTDRYLSGNKYRKLYKLLQTSPDTFDTIISYGGTQSNAMLAIAAMCFQKGWMFLYYTKPLSDIQKKKPSGNYAYALSLGMQHIEIQQFYYKEFIATLRFNLNDKTYVIDQGGALQDAKLGLEVLAKEIQDVNIKVGSLATPSGTGTTALFLALSLPEYKVYTTPSVGDANYLRKQMNILHQIPDNLIILESDKKYHFAKLYPDFFEIYTTLLRSGIEFDLLYAPQMWKVLLEQVEEEVLYIHSGGVSGNKSMLERYAKRGFIL